MKRIFLIIGFLILISSQFAFPQYSSSSFYIVAHQDDWQLFMGKDAYHDMSDIDNKVVFIYLTTGDACNKTGNCAFKIPYFKARENGAKGSVYLVVDKSTSPPAGKERPGNSNVMVNKHFITKWQYKNVVKYFLRLPDGRLHFNNPPHYTCGFDVNDSTYLNHFRRGVLHTLSDITGLTTYSGWSDLVTTVLTILSNEKIGSSSWIHTNEYSPALNGASHADHRETGLIVENICTRTLGLNVSYHIDYKTYNMPVNLSNEDIMRETGLFAAYNEGKTHDGCPSDWNENDMQFCLRDYVSRYFISAEVTFEKSGKPGFQIEALPNPAFELTTVSIHVPNDDVVTCSIYDLNGRLVKNIINRQILVQGKHFFVVTQVQQGVYILKVTTVSGFNQAIKVFFK